MDNTNDQFYSEAFKRNRGLISDEDQAKLRKARVAIAGLGAAGGVSLTTLLRLGVEKFNIADNDVFDTVNHNRQAGAFVSTKGQPKVEVMAKIAQDINPNVDIRKFDKGISPENIDEFLKDVTVVMDGMDFFNMDARLLLYRKAREHKIPVVGSAPIGFGSALHTFTPDGMSFEEYCDIRESQSLEEKLLRFGIGLGPSLLQRSYYPMKVVNFKDKAAPSSILSISLVGNLNGTQAFKVITGKKYFSAPHSMHFDPYVGELRKVYIKRGNKSLMQRLKIWYIKKKLKIA